MLPFNLDLRLPDEWRVARVLTRLSLDEKGNNFRPPMPYAVEHAPGTKEPIGGPLPTVQCALFRRNHGTDWIAGWELPANWDEKDYKGGLTKGVPHEGHLIVDYSSRAEDGCEANPASRDELARGFFLSGMPRPGVPPTL